MEASFDHGGDEGYGLWLDPAVAEDPVYAEHWKGHEAVEVTIEPDRIVIRRGGAPTANGRHRFFLMAVLAPPAPVTAPVPA